MFILGLTGSIGMGKSTTAGFFRAAGVPVHDSDAVVHRLYEGEAVAPVEAAFPGVTVGGRIDRAKLAAQLVGQPDAIKQLESIVHPLVRTVTQRFIAEQAARGARVIVLDIPLLFETSGEKNVDAVVVVSAPADVQRARVLSRPGMAAEKFDALLARQMSDAEKRARAHFVVDSSRSFDSAHAQVLGILRAVASLPGGGESIKTAFMREIVFDTETTGLDPYQGDRLVEIGCVELLNGFPTGNSFHRYLNPERDVPDGAFKVHGLSAEFLKDKPLFADICEEFLAFVGDAPLIAHNAMFDLGFINAELERCKKALLQRERLVDTLMLARRRYPAGPNRLDDLCARFSIDASRRTKHGALLDAELLAEVYVELTGKRQSSLGLIDLQVGATPQIVITVRARPAPLAPRLTEAERAAHRAFVATLGDKAIWNDYWAAA